jgi:hypothetical protein
MQTANPEASPRAVPRPQQKNIEIAAKNVILY